MSVLFMFVWIVEEELFWRLNFRYITFFNIYYVNLDIVRNNELTVARSPAASYKLSHVIIQKIFLTFNSSNVSYCIIISYF